MQDFKLRLSHAHIKLVYERKTGNINLWVIVHGSFHLLDTVHMLCAYLIYSFLKLCFNPCVDHGVSEWPAHQILHRYEIHPLQENNSFDDTLYKKTIIYLMSFQPHSFFLSSNHQVNLIKDYFHFNPATSLIIALLELQINYIWSLHCVCKAVLHVHA